MPPGGNSKNQTISKNSGQFSPLTLLGTTLSAGTSQWKAVVPTWKKPCGPCRKYCRCSWETQSLKWTPSKYRCCTLTSGHHNFYRGSLIAHQPVFSMYCPSVNLTCITLSVSIPPKQIHSMLLSSDLTATLLHKVILESF